MKNVKYGNSEGKVAMDVEAVLREVKRVATLLESRNHQSRVHITLGMEGTADRGLTWDDASAIMDAIRQHEMHRFMLLLKGELPAGENIPRNCMVGVEVRTEDDLDSMDALLELNAFEYFVMFVPDVPIDVESIDLTGFKWTILEGNPDEELQEWEVDMTCLVYESTYRLAAYDKSFEDCGYVRGVMSDKIVGCRYMKYV